MPQPNLVVSILAVLVSTALFNCDGSIEVSSPDNEVISRGVDITPVWEDATDSSEFRTIRNPGASDFYLLLDRSIPMGGYIHKDNKDSSYLFVDMQDEIESAIKSSDYESSEIKCVEITDEIRSPECWSNTDLMIRKAFGGNSSRIDRAIQLVFDSLKDGSITGVALISDLMSTTESGRGGRATNLLSSFKPFERDFNESKIHMAVVGIRPQYWGVHSETCPVPPDSLTGCWFHEGRERYYALNEVVSRPIYVLLIGRSLKKGDNRRENPINVIMKKLEEAFDIRDFGVVKSELLTHGTLGGQTSLDFSIPKNDRGHKLINYVQDRGCTCTGNDDKHILTATFNASEISIVSESIELADSLGCFPQRRPEIEKNGMVLNLDCACTRSLRPKRSCERENVHCDDNNGIIRSELSRLTMMLEHSPDDWEDWSARVERSDATYYLANLIKGLRPSHYRATISPVLPLACCSK